MELSIKDPILARDLMIGRPDLTRQYYDGGLVDVNHVPEAVLVSHLGLTPDQARTVVAARDHLAGFARADETLQPRQRPAPDPRCDPGPSSHSLTTST